MPCIASPAWMLQASSCRSSCSSRHMQLAGLPPESRPAARPRPRPDAAAAWLIVPVPVCRLERVPKLSCTLYAGLRVELCTARRDEERVRPASWSGHGTPPLARGQRRAPEHHGVTPALAPMKSVAAGLHADSLDMLALWGGLRMVIGCTPATCCSPEAPQPCSSWASFMVVEKDKLQSDSLGRRRHRHGRNSEVERTPGMLSSSAPSEEVERAPGCSPAALHRHLDWVRFVEAEMALGCAPAASSPETASVCLVSR
jgi:hypothetical protein